MLTKLVKVIRDKNTVIATTLASAQDCFFTLQTCSTYCTLITDDYLTNSGTDKYWPIWVLSPHFIQSIVSNKDVISKLEIQKALQSAMSS